MHFFKISITGFYATTLIFANNEIKYIEIGGIIFLGLLWCVSEDKR